MNKILKNQFHKKKLKKKESTQVNSTNLRPSI
jgi:hypothetical protein